MCRSIEWEAQAIAAVLVQMTDPESTLRRRLKINVEEKNTSSAEARQSFASPSVGRRGGTAARWNHGICRRGAADAAVRWKQFNSGIPAQAAKPPSARGHVTGSHLSFPP